MIYTIVIVVNIDKELYVEYESAEVILQIFFESK